MISEEHTWEILRHHFRDSGFVHHQIDSFDDYIHHGIRRILCEEPDILIQRPDVTYRIIFNDVYIPGPTVIEDDRTLRSDLSPKDCRERDITYDAPIYVYITEIIQDMENTEQPPEINHHHRVIIGRTPIMLRSSLCNLANKTPRERVQLGECPYDQGGYFVVRGNDRVLVAQMRNIYNKVLVLPRKPDSKFSYTAEVRSMSEETGHSVLVQASVSIDKRNIIFSLPYIRETVPAGIIFKILGVGDLQQLQTLIGLQSELADPYIRVIARDTRIEDTPDDAARHVGQFVSHTIKDTDKASYARQVIESELFPHMGVSATIREKTAFLAHIINKLIATQIGLRQPDDRDNYINKRIEPAGVLCCELFRTLFKRFTCNVKSQLEKKRQRPDALAEMPRINIITNGLRHAFGTGNWGVQQQTYIKVGVSQVLSRLTYGATLSHLRRVMIQAGKESKNTKIRQIHPSQAMFICPSETPEGASIGVVLNLSLLTHISNRVPTVIVREAIEGSIPQLQHLLRIDPNTNVAHMTKVFLNGTLLGYTNDVHGFTTQFKHLRDSRIIPRSVSIGTDDIDQEIYIYSDEGRLLRPLFAVDQQQLRLSLDMGLDWDQLVEFGAIVYADNSELDNAVIAFNQHELSNYHNDYCEIAAAMMLGVMASIIPFPDHSQGPRNCYQCLHPDTPVRLADNSSKPIRDIKPGDLVVSFNPETCTQTITPVIAQYVRYTDKPMITLTTESGRTLTCTEDHPILTPIGWVQAKDATQIGVLPLDSLLAEKLRVHKHTGSDLPWNPETRDAVIFVKIDDKTPYDGHLIADITTKSDNHSFVANDLCVHNSSMGKQAMGVFALSHLQRTDTIVHVLETQQKPLVSTKAAEMMGFSALPSGINATVAIACYGG